MKKYIKLLVFFFVAFSCKNSSNELMKNMDFKSFEMKTPKSWVMFQEKGIDSYVGGITMDNDEKIYFDYGSYSNNLKDLEIGNNVRFEKIDGFSAKIISSGKEINNTTGIYFDSIQVQKEDPGKVKLQFSGKNISEKNEKQLLKSFQTLKFKK